MAWEEGADEATEDPCAPDDETVPGPRWCDFLRSQSPTFAFAKEPLDADDWLRALERKFSALHVPAAEPSDRPSGSFRHLEK